MQEKIRTQPIKAVSNNIMGVLLTQKTHSSRTARVKSKVSEIHQRKESEIWKGPDAHSSKRKAGRTACWVTPTN